jgi:[NiFe] hydrogenase assembly HybE family chaperone
MSPDLDPSLQLESLFRQIEQTRMQGIPILNPALQVRAIGFRQWDGPHGLLWVGVLLTPWFMNLLLLPAATDSLPPVAPGGEVVVALPGDALPFLAGHEDALGDYRLCSLFSPVMEFADQASACATAEEVLKLLFPPAQPAAPDLSRRRLFGLRA